MSWKLAETLAWEEPLVAASRLVGSDMALLYSGRAEAFTGQTSYLFTHPLETVEGSDWAALPTLPADITHTPPLPLWVGYLGYGLRDEKLRGAPSPISLPDFRLVRYAQLWRFDHQKKCVERFTDGITALDDIPNTFNNAPTSIAALSSNLTRTSYEAIVAQTIEQIRSGNFYQANITRKFYGEFAEATDNFALFQKLCAASPAPYSAYIRHGGSAILSSSPECFLTIDENATMTTRPIKGSARRGTDEASDKKIRDALTASEKNHAENLMIVDLMRNDLARVSTPTSVRVTEQSALYSYATIHHLISTITAQKNDGLSTYEALRACFPAGSMTGAPKIAAIDWCCKHEQLERGVYSGAIGWFGAGGTCDLSVVIRTLIIEGNRFEFQVGGGIVADSTPEDEWRETLVKARGIIAALELSENDLAKL